MPTQEHDRVSANMSVSIRSAILEPIFHLEKHLVVPLIQSPLSSASTALCYSTPSLMDFQMEVHTFFGDLTGIRFCVERWRARTLIFQWCVMERLWIQSRNISAELVWKGQMWNFMHVSTLEQTVLLWTTSQPRTSSYVSSFRFSTLFCI